MPVNPALLNGYVAQNSLDVDAIADADGSHLTRAGTFAVPPTFGAPLLKHDAVNGRKSLVFSTGQALSRPLAADPSPSTGNLSGGAFPGGFSAVAVVKFNTLAALSGNPNTPRRTILGFSGAVRVPASGIDSTGWSVLPNGKLEATPRHHATSGYWGDGPPSAAGVVPTDTWVVLGIRTNGQTMTLWRGRNVDRTSTNAFFGAGYSQFVDGLTIGADAAIPGWHDLDGEVAYLAVYDRAITDAEYTEAFLWLADRYGLPARDIDIAPFVGVGGNWMFLPLKDAATGTQANLTNGQPALLTSTFSYRIDGGAPQNPRSVVATIASLYPDLFGLAAYCPLIAIELNAKAAAGQSYTLSVAGNVIQTDRGYVDALTDAPATNHVGQASILPWTVPANLTMTQGYNLSYLGQYWTSETSTKNLFHGSGHYLEGQRAGDWTFHLDGNGYLTNPRPGETILLRACAPLSIADQPSSVRYEYPGAEPGRYVVSWEGPDGLAASLVPSLDDGGHTAVTLVAGLDVLTGPRKKRYYDIAYAPGSQKKRLSFAFRYPDTTAHLTAIDVRLERYEETEGHFADQILDRMEGFSSVRYLDLVQINLSNIGKASDLCPVDAGTWAWTTERTTPAITRIEKYDGPYAGRRTDAQHLKVTFAGPHGLATGQGFIVKSTDGNPIPLVLSDETVDLNASYVGDYFQGHTPLTPIIRLSDTEVAGMWYRQTEPDKPVVTPFTGANAVGFVPIIAGAPPEAMAWLVNEAGVPTCHILIPAAADDECVDAIADRVIGELEPGKKLRVEWSNEIWNIGFPQSVVARMYTALLTGDESTEIKEIGYAYRATQVYDRVLARWVADGRDPADCRLYLNCWYVSGPWTRDVLAWIAANRPDITDVFVGVAPYAPPNCLALNPGVDYASMDADTILDFAEADIIAFDNGYAMAAQKAVIEASPIDCTLVAYETQMAGFGLSRPLASGTNEERWARHNLEHFLVYNHPRAYGITIRYNEQLQAAGLTESTIYGYQGGYAQEIQATGNRCYGEYDGLEMETAARPDGPTAAANLAAIIDGSGNPRWPDSLPRGKFRASAKQDWQKAIILAPPSALTAQFATVSPDPRDTPVDSVALTLSEPATGLALSDFNLKCDGLLVSLAGATLTGSGASYTVSGLASATDKPGKYTLALFSPGSKAVTGGGRTLLKEYSESWEVRPPRAVGARRAGDDARRLRRRPRLKSPV